MRSYKLPSAIAIAVLVFGFTKATLAQETYSSQSLITPEIIENVQEWLDSPIVTISINAQNRRYSDLSAVDVEDLDTQWRSETDSQDQPLIAAILGNPLSTYLTQIQAQSGGLYTEMFIMDAKGLNVGQSAVTSDFWQGDEAKFQRTYEQGHGVIFVDQAEFHEGTGTWRAQANFTISENQQPIGAITVEFNLTEIARRNAAS